MPYGQNSKNEESYDDVINDYYSKATMHDKPQIKMEFNKGIVEAWFDIDKEIFDTLEFSNKDKEINSFWCP